MEPIVLIALIAFAATLFRSTFGFGEALVAVPLLGLFLPMTVAVPLAVLMSVLVAGVVLIQDHDKVHLHSVKWLILFAMLGMPFGLALLVYGDEAAIRIILGAIIILYSAYTLIRKSTFHLEKESTLWLFICGFLSGVFGGAYGVNGPPLAVYGNLRRWDAQYFRATLQLYFLVAGVVSLGGYAYTGMIDQEVLLHFAYAVPATIPAIYLGRSLNRRINGHAFYRYVYAGLMLIGVMLIVNALSGTIRP